MQEQWMIFFPGFVHMFWKLWNEEYHCYLWNGDNGKYLSGLLWILNMITWKNSLWVVGTMFLIVWISTFVIRTGELTVHSKGLVYILEAGKKHKVNNVVGNLYLYVPSTYGLLCLLVIRVAWAQVGSQFFSRVLSGPGREETLFPLLWSCGNMF